MDSKKITILCSSPRRQYNLENFIENYLPQKFDEVCFENIRGNIPTRFKKFLEDPNSDGFIVAKAAIDRLLLNNYSEFNELKTTLKKYINECLWSVLPLSINPCSPGQGALAIETRIKDNKLNEILNDINFSKDYSNVIQERNILKNYGGGCHQKIGVSYISHKLGLVVSKRGEDENGNHFESWDFIDPKDISFSSNTTDEIYPENLKNYKIFSRKQLNENVDDINNLQNKCIYVSRISSIPDKSKIQSNNVIWTSGLRTWKNLSERGIWVNGTSDGLGEDFDKDINSLTNNPWVKLTHSQSPESSIKNKIETYQLESIDFEIDIEKKKYFYWMSSSAFKASIDKYPKIIEKYHFCGPGNTYNEISKILGNDKNLFVELSYDSWKKKITKSLKMTNILFENALKRNIQKTPPIWFMRQAGRYHSHYRKLKEKYTFEELCKTPDLAAEVAFGPIQEFDYDIAILFSDILFILEGLGLELKFDPGPKFNSYINSENINDYSNIDRGIEHMQFQFEAIKITKEKLPNNKSLIGFVGGPWTLSKYAFGNNNSDLIDTKMNLEFISKILLPLLKKNIQLQLDAGVELVMIFDSSLYDLDKINFHEIYSKFLEEIAISFPNKLGYYSRGKSLTDLNSIISFPFAGFGYDHTIDLKFMFENQKHGFIQGNFNEQLMLSETDTFLNDLKDFIKKMKSIENLNGWICGLGHGINKNTPEKNVHLFIENIRKEFS